MLYRRRRIRRFAVLLIAGVLVTASMASTALAALANVDIGGGGVVDAHARAATPQQVSPGNVAGFYLWVRNADAANLSSFFMTAMTDATPLGAYWQRQGEGETFHACTTSGGLQCSFGPLNSGDVLFIVAAFTVPSPASASTANCLAPGSDDGFGPTTEDSWVCVDFRFGASSGFVPGKNRSRGDDYHWFDYVATDVGGDQGAQFPFCDRSGPTADCLTDLLTVFNSGHNPNKNDVQTTEVTAPPGAFNSAHGSTGLAVADNFPFSCEDAPGVPTCASHQGTGPGAFVGQWSDVDVNSEQEFDHDFLQITIEMYGVNPNSIDGVIHLWQDTFGVWHEEVIADECPSADGPAEGQMTPCFWVSGSGNVTNVSIWTQNNGNYRTF